MRKKIFTLVIVSVFFLTAGLGCKNTIPNYKPVTLEYWGVFESPETIQQLTGAYTSRHPQIAIHYRQLREDEYKQKLLEAWALGQGPDLFMIPNTRMHEYLKFITPMPATMEAPVQYETGAIKKETINELRTYNGYTTRQLKDTFLDVVSDDAVINNQIYGLPYGVDTLSVFYNRELLKNNNIPLPAKNWKELLNQASIISKVDTKDALVQSTIALGTTNNIPSVFDVVSTLMMQVGITMGDATGPLFQSNPDTLSAIQFYLSFAHKGLQNYSWNQDMPAALSAFTSGKLAYFIGYPYYTPMIKQANPKLDFDVIPIFKPENVDVSPAYASYWLNVVAKPPKGASADAAKKAEIAWQFLSESTQAQYVRPYLSNPEQPRTTALRSLVDAQKSDPIVGPFAQNLLNAKSWYHGYDYDIAEKAFTDMIANIGAADANSLDVRPYISAGASIIGQTYSEPTQ